MHRGTGEETEPDGILSTGCVCTLERQFLKNENVLFQVTSLAALDALVEQDPHAVENCVETAGFSVGEYAALVFAGVMSYETGLFLCLKFSIMIFV